MNVCLFCNEFPPRPHGGIGSFVSELANNLAKTKNNVTIVQFGLVEALDYFDNIRIYTIRQSRMRFFGGLIDRINLYLWLRKQVINGLIDIIELPDYQGFLPIPFNYCPIVIRLHMTYSMYNYETQNIRKLFSTLHNYERLTLYFHRNWVHVSNYILDQTISYFGIKPHSTVLIYNPAPRFDDVGFSNQDLPNFNYILFVGSITEKKGALKVAYAMSRIFNIHMDLNLVYVGPLTDYKNKPISDSIYNAIGGVNKHRVHFTGQVEREIVFKWMKYAVAVVFVSEQEAFGLVTVEAMAVGVPVIVSNRGANKEIISNNLCGFMVDPKSVDEIVENILTVINDSTLRCKVIENAKKIINDEFSLDSCRIKTLNYYNSLMIKTYDNAVDG